MASPEQFHYEDETRKQIETALLIGSPASKVGQRTWKWIEGAAEVYCHVVSKSPGVKKLRESLERLQESLDRVSADLESALPALELAIHEAETYGGLGRVLANFEDVLSPLRALAQAAEAKLPKKSKKGRPRQPSVAGGPNILGGIDFNVGSPLEWFIDVLATIWAKYHDGARPKRRTVSTTKPSREVYPPGWEDMVFACVDPLEMVLGRYEKDRRGVVAAIRRVSSMAKKWTANRVFYRH